MFEFWKRMMWLKSLMVCLNRPPFLFIYGYTTDVFIHSSPPKLFFSFTLKLTRSTWLRHFFDICVAGHESLLFFGVSSSWIWTQLLSIHHLACFNPVNLNQSRSFMWHDGEETISPSPLSDCTQNICPQHTGVNKSTWFSWQNNSNCCTWFSKTVM